MFLELVIVAIQEQMLDQVLERVLEWALDRLVLDAD